MTPLAALLGALADLTAMEPRPDAQATAAALRAALDHDFPPAPPSTIDAAIRRLAAHPDAHPVAARIAAAQGHVPWQDSPLASRQPADLRAIKSVATLLGPVAPIASDTHLFGLFYQAPGAHYPLHAHNAAETYTLLAGTALLQAGENRFPLGPGEAVHHPPNLPHAMRAGPEGFLAMWRWSGDIDFASYLMLPDP